MARDGRLDAMRAKQQHKLSSALVCWPNSRWSCRCVSAIGRASKVRRSEPCECTLSSSQSVMITKHTLEFSFEWRRRRRKKREGKAEELKNSVAPTAETFQKIPSPFRTCCCYLIRISHLRVVDGVGRRACSCLVYNRVRGCLVFPSQSNTK